MNVIQTPGEKKIRKLLKQPKKKIVFRQGPRRECDHDMGIWNFGCVTSAEVLGKLEQTQQEMHQDLINSTENASRLDQTQVQSCILKDSDDGTICSNRSVRQTMDTMDG
jgi:hypothetical protein